jgi:hypothetical protein
MVHEDANATGDSRQLSKREEQQLARGLVVISGGQEVGDVDDCRSGDEAAPANPDPSEESRCLIGAD